MPASSILITDPSAAGAAAVLAATLVLAAVFDAVLAAALAGFALALVVLAAGAPQAEKSAAVAATHNVKIMLVLMFFSLPLFNTFEHSGKCSNCP